jgi:hypothetical protein
MNSRLRVCENRVMRRISGPERDEVTGGWRKLYNKELHNLYCSPDEGVSVVGHVARMRQIKNAYTILFRKPEGTDPRKTRA